MFSNYFLWKSKKSPCILIAFIQNKKAQPLSFHILLSLQNLPQLLLPTLELGYSGLLICRFVVCLADSWFFYIYASEVFYYCSLKAGTLTSQLERVVRPFTVWGFWCPNNLFCLLWWWGFFFPLLWLLLAILCIWGGINFPTLISFISSFSFFSSLVLLLIC